MPSVFLAPYAVRVRRRYHPNEAYLPLGDLGPGDLFHEFQAFLRDLHSSPSVDKKGKTLLAVRELKVPPRTRSLEGTLETGHYGYRSRLVHSSTLTPSYDRKVDDAELLPFFFLFYLPRRPDQGILLLQRLGGWGVKAVLEREIVKRFKATPYLIELHPLLPEALVARLSTMSKATRIRLVSFEVPKDIAEAFARGDRKQLRAELAITVKGQRDFRLPRSLRDLLRGRRRRGGFVEAQGSFPHSRIQVEVEGQDKKTHKVSFDEEGLDLAGYFDVTNDVVMEEGHPTYSTIRKEAQRILFSVRRQIQSVEPSIPAPDLTKLLPPSEEASPTERQALRKTS